MMGKAEILAAIREAARELGRTPSRGELKRLTGVSHYRVLTQFRSLREAVRAAGLEPSRKGERVSTEELMKDWERVRKKLGRRPSRTEYVREGKFSAGTFVGRFGAWSRIGDKFHHRDTEARRKPGKRIASNAKSAEESKLKSIHHRGHREAQRKSEHRKARAPKPANHKGHEGAQRILNGVEARRSDKAIAFQRGKEGSLVPALAVTAPLVQDDKSRRGCFGLRTAIPGPLEGKRRVTEGIAAIIVNTLMPANSNWQSAIGPNQKQNRFTTEERRARQNKEGYLGPSLAVKTPLVQDDRRKRGDFAPRGLYKD